MLRTKPQPASLSQKPQRSCSTALQLSWEQGASLGKQTSLQGPLHAAKAHPSCWKGTSAPPEHASMGLGCIFCSQTHFENHCGRSFCLRQEARLSPCTEHSPTELPMVPLPHICTASAIHRFTASPRHKRLFVRKSNSRKSFVVLCFQKSCHLAAENNRNLHSVLCQELPRQSEVLSQLTLFITHGGIFHSGPPPPKLQITT